MDIKFRNKSTRLNTLDASTITSIINNISKKKENQFKKHLNDVQVNEFLKDIAQSIKTEANEVIYKDTIESLIQQYENNIKPIITQELKFELKSSVTEQLKSELKSSVIEQLKSELKASVTEQLKSELKASVTEQLKSELKVETEMNNGKNNNSEHKLQMNQDMVRKMVAYKLMNAK